MTTKRRLGSIIGASLLVAVVSAIPRSASTSSASESRSRIAVCLQGALQTAIEQRVGYGTAQNPLGYTILVVNVTPHTCELRGFPYEIIFSTATGEKARLSMSHNRNALYAEPSAQLVTLRPGGVASFGLSYEGINVPPPGEPTRCLATLLDFRLPARLSNLFSYEYVIRPIVICGSTLHAQVTPIEGRTTPLA